MDKMDLFAILLTGAILGHFLWKWHKQKKNDKFQQIISSGMQKYTESLKKRRQK